MTEPILRTSQTISGTRTPRSFCGFTGNTVSPPPIIVERAGTARNDQKFSVGGHISGHSLGSTETFAGDCKRSNSLR